MSSNRCIFKNEICLSVLKSGCHTSTGGCQIPIYMFRNKNEQEYQGNILSDKSKDRKLHYLNKKDEKSNKVFRTPQIFLIIKNHDPSPPPQSWPAQKPWINSAALVSSESIFSTASPKNYTQGDSWLDSLHIFAFEILFRGKVILNTTHDFFYARSLEIMIRQIYSFLMESSIFVV